MAAWYALICHSYLSIQLDHMRKAWQEQLNNMKEAHVASKSIPLVIINLYVIGDLEALIERREKQIDESKIFLSNLSKNPNLFYPFLYSKQL